MPLSSVKRLNFALSVGAWMNFGKSVVAGDAAHHTDAVRVAARMAVRSRFIVGGPRESWKGVALCRLFARCSRPRQDSVRWPSPTALVPARTNKCTSATGRWGFRGTGWQPLNFQEPTATHVAKSLSKSADSTSLPLEFCIVKSTSSPREICVRSYRISSIFISLVWLGPCWRRLYACTSRKADAGRRGLRSPARVAGGQGLFSAFFA